VIGGTQGLLLEKWLPGAVRGGKEKRRKKKDLKKGPSVLASAYNIDTGPPIVNFFEFNLP
jgi:hypothetical protein